VIASAADANAAWWNYPNRLTGRVQWST